MATNKMTVTQFARLGGVARAAALTPERRREIAALAGKAPRARVNGRTIRIGAPVAPVAPVAS